jgi:hypothetical protein
MGARSDSILKQRHKQRVTAMSEMRRGARLNIDFCRRCRAAIEPSLRFSTVKDP